MRRKDDEKEQRIKEAVASLMLEEGWSGTSISKIARKAEVSPATVYTYFDSKEDMLQCIYREYSEHIFDYMMEQVRADMGGGQVIDTLMRSFYRYMTENEDICSFIEQFGNCRALASKCSCRRGIGSVSCLLEEMKRERVIRDCSEKSLEAVIFYPVKAIVFDQNLDSAEKSDLQDEIIRLGQHAILL